ncbi:rCG53239, partial [Rattus norvegicus]
MTIQPSFNNAHVSKYSDQNSTELMNSVMVRTEEEIADTD